MIKLSIFRQKPFKTISDCYFFSLERRVSYLENTYAILQRLFEPKELIAKKCNFWPNKPQVSPFEKKISFWTISYRYFSSQERFVFSLEYTYAFILNPFGPKERIEKNCNFGPKAIFLLSETVKKLGLTSALGVTHGLAKYFTNFLSSFFKPNRF